MYLYVKFQEKESYYKDGPYGREKARLEDAAGERCLLVPYQEMDMSVIREVRPRAIAMGGLPGHWHDRKIEWFYGVDEVLHQAPVPTICFCGSHQLLGYGFNGDIRRMNVLRDNPMRKLRPDEDVSRKAIGPHSQGCDLSAYFVADGFYPIRQVRKDPLFAGLPKLMTMKCTHYCEIKKLPKEFEIIATSAHCRIEAIRHKSRPLYGTQFHPEAYEAPFFHGRKLLQNFAAIVDRFWSKAGTPEKVFG